MARRPNVFDAEAMAAALRRQGLAESMVNATISDFRLMMPLVLHELGAERVYALCEQARAELHLNPGAFWPDIARAIVAWADSEIATYKAQKEPKEP